MFKNLSLGGIFKKILIENKFTTELFKILEIIDKNFTFCKSNSNLLFLHLENEIFDIF